MKDISKLAAEFREEFESLVVLGDLKTDLEEYCRYALFPAGKCFRAGLCLFTGQLLGIPRESLLGFAAAAEILHASSLVHDDLPALDNDDLRRGQASAHKKFGEAAAILGGDALFAIAQQTLSVYSRSQAVDAEIQLALLDMLFTSFVSVCEGQVLDLQASGIIPKGTSTGGGKGSELLSPEAELELRHTLKTATLIKTSMLGPTLFLAESERQRHYETLSEAGQLLGLLFQITDDILEATSDASVLGKNVDSDERKGTPTYVSVHGLERSREIARELSTQGRRLLSASVELAPLQSVYELIEFRKK